MTFLNAILLFGAAATAIPLIIHLLNRRRFRVVRWGAMQFLDAALQTNRRRIQWQQIALLALRMAIPIFLAVAMARPVLLGAHAMIRRAMSSIVILLDNSYSMEASNGLQSTFAAGRDAAAALVAPLPRGSQVAVVGLAGPLEEGLETPSYDLGHLGARLDKAAGGYGMADVPGRLETAAGLFASRMNHADRTLVVISDFQRVSWSKADAPARARALELLAAQPIPPRLVLLPTGRDVRENVAVESVESSKPLPGVGQKISVRANLRNHGTQPMKDLRVYFRADGVERSASQITLAPGEAGQLLFSFAFDQPGSHVLEVAADSDPLKADNVGRLSLPAVDRLPVLVVSGDRRPGLQGETTFLEFALRPFGAARQQAADLIEPRPAGEDGLSTETLNGVRVVILANVRQLDDRALAALQEFVRGGGGLLVFPGDRANVPWYNERLGGATGLLPARVGALSGDPTGATTPAALVAQHFPHPAMGVFNDPRKGSLQGAQIRLWHRLELPAAAAPGSAPAALARMDNGDPFLVEKPFGQGRAILCNTACDADWSNLPLRPFYLPLVQELTVHLASQVYPPRNVRTGERLAALLPADAGGRPAVFTDPDGQTHEAVVKPGGPRGLAEFDGTARPGLYLLRLPGGETIHYVVRTPPEESQLERLSEAELAALAREMNATVVRSAAEYRALEQQRRWGREIWTWLLAVVLALLFGELLLVPWFLRLNAGSVARAAAPRAGRRIPA